jgi:hypothetical protein
LDLLGFIRPNRGFSMSYGEKNKKIPVSLLPPGGWQAAGSIRRRRKGIAQFLLFAKNLRRLSVPCPGSNRGEAPTETKIPRGRAGGISVPGIFCPESLDQAGIRSSLGAGSRST